MSQLTLFLQVLYQSLVKPRAKIKNYLTKFSGITPKVLEGVETRLEDVQMALRKIITPDAILVGKILSHSKQNQRICIESFFFQASH